MVAAPLLLLQFVFFSVAQRKRKAGNELLPFFCQCYFISLFRLCCHDGLRKALLIFHPMTSEGVKQEKIGVITLLLSFCFVFSMVVISKVCLMHFL